MVQVSLECSFTDSGIVAKHTPRGCPECGSFAIRFGKFDPETPLDLW